MRHFSRTASAITALFALALGLGAVGVACAAPHRPTAGSPVTYERAFGGSGQDALVQPFAVALDRRGRVWVADRGSGAVEEFSAAGKVLARFGQHGTLSRPDGIAVGPGGDIWVSDAGHNRIVEFSPHGVKLRAFGAAGQGPGRLTGPAGLAIGPDGTVYVADSGNNRVDRFGRSGRYLSSIKVASPFGVAVSRSGRIWVSSPSYAPGNLLYEFTANGSALGTIGSTQASYGALSNPAGIALGPGGQIYVAQPDYGFVTVLGPGGDFGGQFGLQSKTKLAGRNLAFPQGLAITKAGTVFVADSGHGRIVVFASAGAAGGGPGVAGRGAGEAAWTGSWAWLAGAGMCALAGALLAGRRRRRGSSRVQATGPVPAPVAAPVAAPAPAASTPVVSRRTLIAGATALTGVTAAGVLPLSLRRALAATAGQQASGKLTDIKHIVILMQENRSFDHYYGAMPGVRGFADPTAIKLSSGRSVFHQPDPSHAQGYLLPFHYDTKKTSAQATPGTDHSWPTQHQAWNHGKMDSWIAAKGEFTMGYFTRDDIPFHWALADAFTICDNYHCSVFGPTNPNRLYMWTGMIDPRGQHGGPVIDNTPGAGNVILRWTTYPERLQAAGISWQVYQEEDNFDDNALAWFEQFGSASTRSPLHQRGMRRLLAGSFEDDARHDRLPQVSWLVAPTAQSEHPDFFPAAGAEYIAQKLDAIASNPAVWAKTAFILCYDENDGLFDHVVPPTPRHGTPDEFVGGEPIGLGFRTPTTIVSPWTAGGFVCSDVFDHSSLIRFIEARFGVHEPNISPWRRRTCGDLTTAFRFASGPSSYPASNTRLRLATAEAALLTAQREVSKNPPPAIPKLNQPLPTIRR
ncbi:MAG TPA: phospholipase C, phosphocholine-specific [Streptosporangiaceae bacterium]|nr:phospholipase C, phosphocholine-specific [Streptosporangiaceae bacterium]